MNIDKLQQLAKREAGISETMAFRLTPEDKEAFIQKCDQHALSVGKVLRLLVAEFIAKD